MGTSSFRLRCATTTLLLLSGAHAHAPHDVDTELAISPAFATDRTLFAAFTLTDNDLFAISNDAGRSWRYIGTPMAATLPRHFVFSPQFLTDRTAFAASAGSGAWRTTDGGLTWQLIDTGLPGPGVQDIAISPDFANDHRLIVGTMDGVYASDDGGDSWTWSGGGLAESAIQCVALVHDGAGGLTAFAAGHRLAVSHDGGSNWTDKGVFPALAVSLCASPGFALDQRVAVSFGRWGYGVVLSEDGGDSFAFDNAGLSDLYVEELALANDGSLFAVTDTAGCFRADAPDAPWTLVSKGWEKLSDLTAVHNTEVVVSPDFVDDGTVFVGAFEGTYRSYDRGDDWLQLDVYTQLLNRRLVVSAPRAGSHEVLTGNYGGGVFHYAEKCGAPLSGASGSGAAGGALAAGGAGGPVAGSGATGGPVLTAPSFSWDARPDDLLAPWSGVFAASPGASGERTLLYGYTWLQSSTDEGETWVSANKPPGAQVVRAVGFSPQYATDRTVFIGTGMTGSFRSDDACSQWQPIEGLPGTLSASAIALSPGWPADGTIFYASRNLGIWRSKDGGANWTKQSAGLPTAQFKALALSPDFVSDGLVLAGSMDVGLFASHDGGASFAPADDGLPPSAWRPVEAIAFSPDFVHDRTVFVALLGDGVWRSTDGAQTWQPTGPGLPAPPADVALSPRFALDRTLFVGTFSGTYVSRDAGASWQPLPGYVRVDDGHPAVIDEGATWKIVASAGDVAGGVSQTKIAGDATWLEFYGRTIAWYTDLAADGALARILLDGAAVQLVDTASPVPQHQVQAFTHDFGAAGWHVVRIEHAGSSHLGSPAALRSDGFEYAW